MHTIGIVGNSPCEIVPNLTNYSQEIDLWIGVDRGALMLINQQIKVDYAIGDFDSVNEIERETIHQSALSFIKYPSMKDETDLELAITKAVKRNPNKIYLFGVTGGRLDHELINIQLLLPIVKQGIRAKIIDKQNIIEMTTPTTHTINRNKKYPYVSFVPFSKYVKGLTLDGFRYPLKNYKLKWGSTLCLSNELLSNSGTFLYEEGILLVIKSRDR